jgi:predicted Zn-dependent protease
MANLNLEVGTTPLREMIGKIEKGILMNTNPKHEA